MDMAATVRQKARLPARHSDNALMSSPISGQFLSGLACLKGATIGSRRAFSTVRTSKDPMAGCMTAAEDIIRVL
jgi:hypothetical protein